jgi:hypothetical protein
MSTAKPVPESAPALSEKKAPSLAAKEIRGPKGLEPTRYGDWERNGKCVDF